MPDSSEIPAFFIKFPNFSKFRRRPIPARKTNKTKKFYGLSYGTQNKDLPRGPPLPLFIIYLQTSRRRKSKSVLSKIRACQPPAIAENNILFYFQASTIYGSHILFLSDNSQRLQIFYAKPTDCLRSIKTRTEDPHT